MAGITPAFDTLSLPGCSADIFNTPEVFTPERHSGAFRC
jgi:hypothetical protein